MIALGIVGFDGLEGRASSESQGISRDKINRYIEFVKTKTTTGTQVASQTRGRETISTTRDYFINYHEGRIGFLYTKDNKGISLSTVLERGSSKLAFMEHINIDGIPEMVLPFGEFQDLARDNAKLLRVYHQIINYVVDSLPKKS